MTRDADIKQAMRLAEECEMQWLRFVQAEDRSIPERVIRLRLDTARAALRTFLESIIPKSPLAAQGQEPPQSDVHSPALSGKGDYLGVPAVVVAALTDLLDRYTGLVNCGDCGNWDPETEPQVIAARAALSLAATTATPAQAVPLSEARAALDDLLLTLEAWGTAENKRYDLGVSLMRGLLLRARDEITRLRASLSGEQG